MSDEIHIAGVVVHALPQAVEAVRDAIARMPGADVHGASRDGKLVVTLEASSAREIAGCIDQIQQLSPVLSASLVYQHNEPREAMMEEIRYEDDETRIH